MIEFTTYFIISQIFMLLAMLSDFASFQFKKKTYTFICFAISAALISAHYFLLGKTTAGIIVFFSVIRFITCIYTTNKKFLYLFIILNTLALVFTYQDAFDLIVYSGLVIIITANFQKDNALMRRMMMIGTSCVIVYNAIIFSPMGILVEGLFLISNFFGYYRHYIRPKKHS